MALYLIGEEHFDIDKYARTAKLLTVLKTTLVGIENTEQSFMQELAAYTRPNALQDGISRIKTFHPSSNDATAKQLLENFIGQPLLFGSYLPGRLVFCDSPEVDSSQLVNDVNDYVQKKDTALEDLLRLSPDQLREVIAKEYRPASYPVADLPELVCFYSERDAFAEQILRSNLALLQPRQLLAYFCGLDHLYGDYHPNLFDRLDDLNPVRMKLSEADNLPHIQRV